MTKAYPLVLAHKLIDSNRASQDSYTALGGRQSSGKVAVAMVLVVVVVVFLVISLQLRRCSCSAEPVAMHLGGLT